MSTKPFSYFGEDGRRNRRGSCFLEESAMTAAAFSQFVPCEQHHIRGVVCDPYSWQTYKNGALFAEGKL